MLIETDRLILRPWNEADAVDLYECAKDFNVANPAGWNAHTSVENSREIIKNILSAPYTYAVVLKSINKPIGSVGLMMKATSNIKLNDNEAEIGYWIGKDYWGQGLIPEAVKALLSYGFNTLSLNQIWCGYFEGNIKSKRVQEKCGFIYHHTNKNIKWEITNDIRTEHITYLTKDKYISDISINKV